MSRTPRRYELIRVSALIRKTGRKPANTGPPRGVESRTEGLDAVNLGRVELRGCMS